MGIVAASVLLAAALVGCDPSGPVTPVRIDFDDATTPFGTVQTTFANQGSAPVHVSVVTAHGGKVTSAAGRLGGTDHAARFPVFGDTSTSPRAVVEVANAGSGDPLDPGTQPFTLGADFTLDEVSADGSATSTDNGDNLVQRGRYDDQSQYKLEIDGQRPACRIKGAAGDLTIHAAMQVTPDRWYRATCRRDSSGVTVSVTWWNADGSSTTKSWTKPGSPGSMTPASASVPITIGGKLLGAVIDPSADQYNGHLDNVFVTIG